MNQQFARFSAKIGLIFGLAVLLLGCASTPPPPTVTVTPSRTLTATRTPSPTGTATATLAAFQAVPTDTPTVTATPLVRRQDSLPTATRTPSPTATPTPVPGVVCTVNAGGLNLREGPSTGHRIVVTLPFGTEITAVKRVADNSWLLVSTGDETVGWVYAPLTDCSASVSALPIALGVLALAPSHSEQAAATATVTPAPTRSPTPAAPPPPAIPVNRWRGEYYDNASLLGQPVLIREDDDLDFNWFLDSPDPRIPSDNFSVRWTGQFNFPEGGDYRFFASADDGVKLYVDGWQVIDSWETGISVDRFGTFADITSGLHTITVEYFESGGYARIHVWAEKITLTYDIWLGEYFDNRYLQDPAVLYRDTREIDFDWGTGSPDPKLGGNNFSVRWKRTLPLDFGDYKFFVETEDQDWVRVTVDGWTVIEEYQESAGRLEGYFARMGGGDVTIVVEYQDHGEKARIKFWWQKQ